MTTHRSLRALPAGLVLGLLTAVSAPAAHGDVFLYSQDRADAQVTDYHGTNESSGPRIVRSQQRGDLTRLSVEHGESTVRIAVGYRAQSKVDSRIDVLVVTSRGTSFKLVHSYRYGYLSNSFLRRAQTPDGGYTSTPCRGLTVVTNPTNFVARVPRSCFERPYQVRVGVQMHDSSMLRDARGQVRRSVVDDVLRTRLVDPGEPRLTGPIRAG